MRFHLVTLFPELIGNYFQGGVVGQAVGKGQITLECINPRSFVHDIHKTIDDRPYGGGDGMVMMAEPLSAAMESIQSSSARRIYLSPQGKVLNHQKVVELASEEELILVCGRYAGVDQRFINKYIDEEISIGDYVLSGGEAAAIVLIDAVARQIEGVLGHKNSAQEDSFAMDGLLEAPLYTRPQEFQKQAVPEFLLSGHHLRIKEIRNYLSLLVTAKKRPDLIQEQHKAPLLKAKAWLESLSEQEQEILGLGNKGRV